MLTLVVFCNEIRVMLTVCGARERFGGDARHALGVVVVVAIVVTLVQYLSTCGNGTCC